MSKITNSQSWVNIFDKHKIIMEISKNNFFDISATAIKSVDGKEPRLMTKIDFKEHLPEIMKENKLSILAIKNGVYRIAKTDPFISGIEETPRNDIIEIKSPEDIISINPLNIRSESSALDIAFLSKICEQVFEEKTDLTIRGRLRGDLNFSLNKIKYDIEGVQIEVDGGYEGKKSINLIEAKIGFRGNMNIRQLLYPQLYWEKLIKKQKEIKTFLFFLQDDLFRFIPYYFSENKSFLDLNNEKTFKFITKDLEKFSLYDIKPNRKELNLTAPFPQADSFERVNSIFFEIAKTNKIGKQELILNFDVIDKVHNRQIDYYLNVLKWMKLVEINKKEISLTKLGVDLAKLSFIKRIQKFAEIVFSEPILNDFLHNKPTNENYFKTYNVSGSTIPRRLQTVKSWVKYFKNKLDEE